MRRPLKRTTSVTMPDDMAPKRARENNNVEIAAIPKVPGRVKSILLENFMCHTRLRLDFDVEHNNCFYIIGPNGSGKSALFAGMNIGLGGRGRANDRGNSLSSYIKEGQSGAFVRIVLTNEGENSCPDYQSEIIIERKINSQSASNYAIKSANSHGQENVISKKKGDLDKILARFNIELENPLSWLSQDRSRQFLQQMKPEKLYELFMVATELDFVEQTFVKVDQYMATMKTYLQTAEARIAEMRTERQRLVDIYDSSIEFEKKKLGLRNLNRLLMWAPIRDMETKINSEMQKLEKWRTAKEKIDNDTIQKQKDYEKVLEEKNNFDLTVAGIENEYKILRQTFTQKESAIFAIDRTYRECNDNLDKKRRQLGTANRELEQTKLQLEKVMGDANRDLQSEEAVLLREKAEIEEKLNSHKKEQERLVDYEQECDRNTNEIRQKEQNTTFELRSLKHQLSVAERDFEMFKASRKNRLSFLGPEIPRIIDLMRKNERLFKIRPIGPIGCHVKLKDPKWAAPIEFCLRKMMNNFICFTAEDRKLFDQLCRENRIKPPTLITTSMMNQKVDVRRFEAPENFTTILRVLDIENPMVFNTLVDYLSLENTLLVEDDDEARYLMQTYPPKNVRQAFTMNCSQVYAKGDRKPYRFYSNPKFDARFFGNDSQFASRNFAKEIEGIKKQIVEIQNCLKQHLLDLKRAESEFNKARKDVSHLEGAKRILQDQIRKINEKYQELQNIISSGDLISNFKQTLEENQILVKKCEEDLKAANQELQSASNAKRTLVQQKNELSEEVRAKREELQSVQLRIDEIEQRLDACQEEIERNNIRKEKLQVMKEKFDKSIINMKTERDNAEQKCLEELSNYPESSQASQSQTNEEDFLKKPNFDDLLPTESLTKQIKEIQRIVRVHSQRNGELVSLDDIRRFMSKFKDYSNRYKYFYKVFKRCEMIVKKATYKIELPKRNLPKQLSKAFETHMMMRNYKGTLKVDHENRVIIIRVSTHKDASEAGTSNNNNNMEVDQDQDDDDDGEGSEKENRYAAGVAKQRRQRVQDLKGLSGGERSYTTSCFIMALWDCVKASFRCLDEFDVFMDMLNRRIIMEMLVDLACQHRENQFFFFTPQGIQELKNRDNIQIFTLPKVRDLANTQNVRNGGERQADEDESQ